MPVDQEERTRRLKAKIRAKMDGLFEGRQFEVVTEITPEYLEGKVDAEGNPRTHLQTPLHLTTPLCVAQFPFQFLPQPSAQPGHIRKVALVIPVIRRVSLVECHSNRR